MTKTVTVSEASRGFSDLINRVRYRNETAILVKGGKAVAKIIPLSEAEFTGKDLGELWSKLPHLSKKEAESFEKDLDIGKTSLPQLTDKWE